VLDGEGSCRVLPTWDPNEPDPTWVTELSVSLEQPLDWDAVNTALAEGPVRVVFEPQSFPNRLDVQRADGSDHVLLLDGGVAGARAVVPGIHTGFDVAPMSHIIVRGFEVTGSDDKGVYWWAGDHVILEDLVVHDNRGTPAMSLDYSNRTGHRSARFVVRNNHVYDQHGECIYIGGSEGTDADSHERVEVVNNLVHDCVDRLGTRNDGVNIKDRMGSVWVHRNVVFRTDWGIEVASPGVYDHNLVFDTQREGFQVSDAFQAFAGPMDFEHNVVVNAGHHGVYLSAVHGSDALLTWTHTTVFGSNEAGVLLGSQDGAQLVVDLVDVALVDNAQGIDGWGAPTATLQDCAASGNDVVLDGVAEGLGGCARIQVSTPGGLTGPDGLWFTADDPWVLDVGAQLPE
jgi:hypothetical protein